LALVFAAGLASGINTAAPAQTLQSISAYLADSVRFASSRPGDRYGIGFTFHRYVLLNREHLDRALGPWESLGLWGNPHPMTDVAMGSGVGVFVGDVKRTDDSVAADAVVFVARLGGSDRYTDVYATSMEGQRWVYRSERYERVYAGCNSRTLQISSVVVTDTREPVGATRSATALQARDGLVEFKLTPVAGSIGDSLIRYLCSAPLPRTRTPAAAKTRDLVAVNLAWVANSKIRTGEAREKAEKGFNVRRPDYPREAKNLLAWAGEPGWHPVGWWVATGTLYKGLYPPYVVLVARADSGAASGAFRDVHVIGYGFDGWALQTAAIEVQSDARRYRLVDFRVRLACNPRAMALGSFQLSDVDHAPGKAFQRPARVGSTDRFATEPGDEVPIPIHPGSPAEMIAGTVCDGASPR
jgi:hypothetical protein